MKLYYIFGGREGDRTPDLRIANAALSQLSYTPNERRCILHAITRCVKPFGSQCIGKLLPFSPNVFTGPIIPASYI